MSPEQLAAQDSCTFPHLRAAWAISCEDVVPWPVQPSSFDELVLPAMLGTFTQEDLCTAEAHLGTLRQEGDQANVESPIWTVVAGDRDEAVKLLGPSPEGTMTDEVLDELWECAGLVPSPVTEKK